MFIRIMASNIWGDYFGNPVEVREEQLGSIYDKYDPDILAMRRRLRTGRIRSCTQK